MKICILTSGHDVYDNRIYYKEILSLKKQYNDIYVVAPGEKDFITEDGIVVKCFAKRKNWHDRFRPMKEMYNIAEKINANVYHAHEPDSFQVALKLKKQLGSKAIYDSHEYHPEGFSEHFKAMKTPITKLIYVYEKFMGKKADYIISVNEILVNKFKEYNNNVALIPNYPVLHLASQEKKLSEKPTFIYVGGLRDDRGIIKILESIELIEEDYKYIFIGPFENLEIENKVKVMLESQLKGKDVIFTGKVPHKEVFKYLEEAWAGFVLLQPINWRYINSEPIKVFEYMMSQTVVIASDFPMMKNIVESSNAGIVVNPTNCQEIAKSIKKIATDVENVKVQGKCGLKAIEDRYNWSICEERLLKLYRELY